LDLDLLFGYEFSPVPLSLCDSKDFHLLNQQQKSDVIKLFEEECPQAFSRTNPTLNSRKWALIIDAGSLLETKPTKTNGTIFDYAKQLLLNNIIPEFQHFDRVDIIFDSSQSKHIKSFTKRHAYDNNKQQEYDLKKTDILNSTKFHEFVHSIRSKLAFMVRECWSDDQIINLLPVEKCLIVAGPQKETIKLMKNSISSPLCSSELLYNLESNHAEADTRLFLHVSDIQANDDDDEAFEGIVIQANDTDVILLSIAHHKVVMLLQYYIKKVNTTTKTFTFINIKEIGELLQTKWNVNEPTILLALHSISGCDTTSFIRYITKQNLFSTYLFNSNQFQDLLQFGTNPTVTFKSIKAAEKLVLLCYSSKSAASRKKCISLDSLRKVMALDYSKKNVLDISAKLPPSSNAFHQHCLRSWRQTYTWRSTFEQFDIIHRYSIKDYGYKLTDDGEPVLQWLSILSMPDDVSLVKCGQCKSGCRRCKSVLYQ
jgi:hypothetical protein